MDPADEVLERPELSDEARAHVASDNPPKLRMRDPSRRVKVVASHHGEDLRGLGLAHD